MKATVADFCGKETYEAGDLSREVGKRVTSRVKAFTGKGTYKFGDVSKEIEKRRVAWVKEVTGKENYEFGDVTKKAVANFTGKDECACRTCVAAQLGATPGGVGSWLSARAHEPSARFPFVLLADLPCVGDLACCEQTSSAT